MAVGETVVEVRVEWAGKNWPWNQVAVGEWRRKIAEPTRSIMGTIMGKEEGGGEGGSANNFSIWHSFSDLRRTRVQSSSRVGVAVRKLGAGNGDGEEGEGEGGEMAAVSSHLFFRFVDTTLLSHIDHQQDLFGKRLVEGKLMRIGFVIMRMFFPTFSTDILLAPLLTQPDCKLLIYQPSIIVSHLKQYGKQ